MSEASDPQLLRMLRIEGPVTKDELRSILERGGFRVPSDQWLGLRLDRLRQKKFVKYLGEGRFSLTGKGILEMPAIASRTSFDVQRALRIGARKT